MTGEKMWQDYCLSTNTDINTKHDTWKFCGGGEFADQLANLVLSGTKTALSENWKRSLCRSIDYPAFQKEKRITLPDALAEEEPLFSGFVRYENTISCKKGEGLLLEISKAAEGVEVFVNGVSAGIQIAAPYRYDLSSLVKEGENELRIEVATTLEREMSQHPDPMMAMMGVKSVPTSESGITGMVYIEK